MTAQPLHFSNIIPRNSALGLSQARTLCDYRVRAFLGIGQDG